jgi:hypothetical protein
MRIPSAFKLGGKKVAVVRRSTSVGKVLGRSYPATGVIHIATERGGLPRTEQQIAETFWHEALHMMLADMGHPHWADEVFVVQLSKRINAMVHTAEFNDGTA